MSKTKKRKIRWEKRKAAYEKMAAAAFGEISKQMLAYGGYEGDNKIFVVVETGPDGNNRFFHIEDEQLDPKSMDISIYRNGNVDVTLRETPYNTIDIPLVRFDEVEDIDCIVSQATAAIKRFVQTFFTDSMHCLLSYMYPCMRGYSWQDCIDSYKDFLNRSDEASMEELRKEEELWSEP